MKFKTKTFTVMILFLILILSISFISASEDINMEEDLNQNFTSKIDEVEKQNLENETSKIKNTKIEIAKKNSYYKDESNLICFLKDNDSRPIKNKKLIISINKKKHIKTTDNLGKITLKLDLKPSSYKVNIKFEGDGNYSSSSKNANITIKKAPLIMKFNNYETYEKSDLFFKVKIINNDTKKPVEGIKLLFKVYSLKDRQYENYYAISNKNGIASLNENLKVGNYKIYISMKNNHTRYKNGKNIARMKVKPTAEVGCCSIYIQISNNEGITSFRRDSTYAANLYIKLVKWYGRTAIKQYKLRNTYFFHSITTSDGWLMGTGGADNPYINRRIERLAGQMVSSKKIQIAKIKRIRRYLASLGIGHFTIKAPDGRYAVVWPKKYRFGKLKDGEYISVPNSRYCFHHGSYDKINEGFVKLGVKIAASDPFGVNRRDITTFHWKATTKEGSTTSTVSVYGSNDNGRYSRRHTLHLKDNIYFKNKFYSKYALPKALNKKLLGKHEFRTIDKLIKIQTDVKAPNVNASVNDSKIFKVVVKDRKTKKAIKGLNVKLKIFTKDKYNVHTIKTNEYGLAKFDTSLLTLGKHKVLLYSGNNKYYISTKSLIAING